MALVATQISPNRSRRRAAVLTESAGFDHPAVGDGRRKCASIIPHHASADGEGLAPGLAGSSSSLSPRMRRTAT